MPFGSSSSKISNPFAIPMATGVPLSERFKVLNETSKKPPVLNIGGFGYGAPNATKAKAPSIFSQPPLQNFGLGLGANSYLQQNRTLAAALLAEQTNALLLKTRLMGRPSQRLTPKTRLKQPVKMRVGFKPQNRVVGGGVMKKRAFNNPFASPRAGFNRPKNAVTPGGIRNKANKGIVVRRGGGGAPSAGGSGISPLNRTAGASGKNWFGAVSSKEDLDSELDAYMKEAKNKPKVPKSKSDLDVELEEYMNARKAQSSSGAVTVSGADDVVMNDIDAPAE